MLKRLTCVLLVVIMCVSALSGCKSNDEEISLSFWHIGGASTESSYHNIVNEFNSTVGKEHGVRVDITYVADNDSLLDKLIASANNEPGANEMPDIIVCSLTAIAIGEEKLIDWNDYVSEEELAEYIPDFLEEGQYEGRQYVLTASKSTDVLYINKNIFDMFSSETGVTYEDLSTWEGLFSAAQSYAEWANASEDPRIKRTTFFMAESIIDYLQLGAVSLGSEIWDGDELDFSSLGFETAFTSYAASALQGGSALSSETITSAMVCGEIIAGLAPSYRLTGFKDTVTYYDNTKEPLDILVLPCPYFEEGIPTAFLRGAGICAIKSEDEDCNEAAALFREWLEGNHDFKLSDVPAKKADFEAYLANADYNDENDPSNLGRTVVSMFSDYKLTSPNYFEDYYSISEELENEMFSILNRYSQMSSGEVAVLAERAYRDLEHTMMATDYIR